MLWEEGFYDHRIRDRGDFEDILEYTHRNPVEKGLVEIPEAWPYSTAHERYADVTNRARENPPTTALVGGPGLDCRRRLPTPTIRKGLMVTDALGRRVLRSQNS